MKLDITICDRYKLQKQISQKAGRSTYLALDNYSQKLVIVKILQFDSFFQWDDLKLFEREANTLKNINHPNIPQYIDYFELDDNNFCGFALVQTYIDAPSLETVIQQGRKFSETELIELATKILDILTYLHQQNPPVIHRDIKPSNILITDRSGNSIGNVYLVDFGSVQTIASKENGTITIVGSYGYIPIEQFSGETIAVSDLYSLGMTLVYVVTGVHPAELQKANGRVQFKSNNISSSFNKWLEKITEPYPDRRYSSAIDAKNALQLKQEDTGYFLEHKPQDTKIELYRDRDIFKITYPLSSNYINTQSKKDDNVLSDLIFLSKLTFGLMILLVLLIAFPGLILFIITAILSVLTIKTFLKYSKLYKTIVLKKDGVLKEGLHEWEQKKVNWKTKIDLKNIDFIIYSPSHTFDWYSDIKGNKIEIPSQLRLVVGKDKYVIQDSNLTEKDYLWLGKELSDFLEMELEIMQGIPQVID